MQAMNKADIFHFIVYFLFKKKRILVFIRFLSVLNLIDYYEIMLYLEYRSLSSSYPG